MDKQEIMKQYPMLSEAIIDGICRYVNERHPVGGFLTAVICNDLKEAFGRADENNTRYLREIIQLFYMEVPSPCWGSKEVMTEWLKGRKDESR